MDTDLDISVVVPVYMGEQCLPELVDRLIRELSALSSSYEIILVNDCSPDNSWSVIGLLCSNNTRVKGLNLSRNFGQHYAITAGLSFSTGEWVVVMDCDLQDQPEEILKLYKKAIEGYDSVFAQRLHRKDSVFKTFQSWIFYKVFSFLTDTAMDSTVANFGIYNRKVVDAILAMGDKIRFLPTMSQWVGFRKAFVPVNHAQRVHGRSSYSLFQLLRLAGDNILAFSDKPLKIFVIIGFFISGISVLIALLYLIRYLLGLITVPGYGSLILSLWFIGGLLMGATGFVGLYIGKIFNQVKGRPLYIVSESLNL